MKPKKIAKAVMVTVVGTGLAAGTIGSAMADSSQGEKCYGIVKAGKNDCGTPKHACAGQAKKDGDKHEWIYVKKGNCKRIVGGHLKEKS